MEVKELKKQKSSYPQKLLFMLREINFLGNARELKSMILDAIDESKSKEKLSLESFIRHINKMSSLKSMRPASYEYSQKLFAELKNLPALRSVTEDLINEAMKHPGYNQNRVASLIGITLQAISNRVKKSRKFTTIKSWRMYSYYSHISPLCRHHGAVTLATILLWSV